MSCANTPALQREEARPTRGQAKGNSAKKVSGFYEDLMVEVAGIEVSGM